MSTTVAERAESDDVEFDAELDKVASSRGKLRKKLMGSDPDAAKMFEEQSPVQKAWGRCVGKLILARSNEQVEEAFAWFEAQDCLEGKKISNYDKLTGFFHAFASGQGLDDAHYRVLRRMFVKANVNS